MTSPYFSKADCSKRCDLFFKQAAQAAREWYDADGNWIASSVPPAARERYWFSLALYGYGEAAFADAVVRRAKIGRTENGVVTNFDIFHTNIACVLLVKHRDQMADDVRQLLEKRVREGFPLETGNRRCDFQFHGYNDNMPAKASMGLILGGEMLNEPAAVEHGLWNLRQMAAMLYRRGINSEWNSPTYTPLTLHSMAEIAECARHPEARELALKIEHRLWLDLAGRFHPEIGAVAPPYSRAYYVDALAHLSNLAAMLWFTFGDIARPSPMELFKPDCGGLVIHFDGNVPCGVSQMSYFASDTYHPPAQAIELLGHKAYPSHAIATAEQGNAGPDYPAVPIRIETVLEPDFAVGTSSIPFLGGEQAEPYGVLYKRTKEIRSFRDYSTVFHKFIINDDELGKVGFPTDENGKTYSNSGEQFVSSRGGMATVQSEASVLAVSHPQLYLGGLEDERAPQLLTRLSEIIAFPSNFGGADEIRIGGRAVDSWSGEAAHGEWIGCRRGRLLIAIRPLVYTADLGPVRVALEKMNHYEVIRSTFYKGPSRTFTRFELRQIFGGFVAEHASVDDYASLSAFMADVSSAQFTDQYLTTRRVRYRRPAGQRMKAVEMEISWSPGSPVPRFTTINGLPPAVDARVQIDGLKESDFPLLSGPWTSVPSHFPWPALSAPCNKHDGSVADREI